MDKNQYLQLIDKRLRSLISNPGFINEQAQIRSKNLLARLSPAAIEGINFTYDEYKTTNECKYLISASNRLVINDRLISPLISTAHKIAAEVFEQLSNITIYEDGKDLLIDSALSYYIAGYQANALCIIRKINSFLNDENEVSPVSYVYESIRLFIERDFVSLQSLFGSWGHLSHKLENELLAKEDFSSNNKITEALSLAGMNCIINCLVLSSKYYLSGDELYMHSALKQIITARKSYSLSGDVIHANLTNNLISIILSMYSRSTWKILQSQIPLDKNWGRYLSILSGQKPSVCEFWPSQIKAIDLGLLADSRNSFVITMPTSAGKTRVAELAILNSLISNPGSKCVYIAPYRALSDEIQKTLNSTLGKVGYRVTTSIGNFDTDEFRSYLEDQCSVLVGTPEKIDLLFRARTEFFKQVSLVVIDESHIVDDFSRGPGFELLITRLKRTLDPQGTKFLCLSAVMPNPEDFAIWLCESEEKVIATNWRPTRQRLAKFSWSGDYGRLDFLDDLGDQLQFVPRLITSRTLIDYTARTGVQKEVTFPNKDSKAQTSAELALKLCKEGPVLVFCSQANWVTSTGLAILKGLQLYSQSGISEPDNLSQVDNSESLSVALEWLGEAHPLIPCLRRRIGLHYGNLPESVKQAIEDDFRRNVLKILISTNTLGQGVNLPVRYVIVHSVSHWVESEDESNEGYSERLKVKDYWNICGRAGRAGNETEGQIIHIVNSRKDERILNIYANKDNIEPTFSAIIKLVKKLIDDRLSDQDLTRFLDSQRISILVEEGLEDMSDEQLLSILSSSLVGVQSKRLGYDLIPFIKNTARFCNIFANEIKDPIIRKLYSSTGLSNESCTTIFNTAKDDSTRIVAMDNISDTKNIDEMLSMGLLATHDIYEARIIKQFPSDTTSLIQLIYDWVHGTDIQLLKERYWSEQTNSEATSKFIENTLSSVLPWVLNAYYKILEYHLNINKVIPPKYFGYLPTMVRFGLDKIEACWARTMGLQSRKGSNIISSVFNELYPEGNFSVFMRWFESLSKKDLKGIPGLEDYQIERLLAKR
jgi:superfamily II DNA/RNA helicase